MDEPDKNDPHDQLLENPKRRSFLEISTTALAATGIAIAAWPFIKSMNPTIDVTSRAKTSIDPSNIAQGQQKTFEWLGKPVFVFHRTEQQINAMQETLGSSKDPEADDKRTQKPEWLIVIGICTHLGCIPNRSKEGWDCPCHGSQYDNSGRVLSGPAPRNLDIPPYSFDGNGKIIIG